MKPPIERALGAMSPSLDLIWAGYGASRCIFCSSLAAATSGQHRPNEGLVCCPGSVLPGRIRGLMGALRRLPSSLSASSFVCKLPPLVCKVPPLPHNISCYIYVQRGGRQIGEAQGEWKGRKDEGRGVGLGVRQALSEQPFPASGQTPLRDGNMSLGASLWRGKPRLLKEWKKVGKNG